MDVRDIQGIKDLSAVRVVDFIVGEDREKDNLSPDGYVLQDLNEIVELSILKVQELVIDVRGNVPVVRAYFLLDVDLSDKENVKVLEEIHYIVKMEHRPHVDKVHYCEV